jgi:inhibitor of cysteine peptidase
MSDEEEVRAVQVGQPFAIDLEAIPGAGYMWELAHPPGEVELASQEIVAISKEVGGSSTQRFTMVAHQPGSYSLKFELKRKWEKDPVKTSVFSIKAGSEPRSQPNAR